MNLLSRGQFRLILINMRSLRTEFIFFYEYILLGLVFLALVCVNPFRLINDFSLNLI